ncbi:IclR family transcriptional regulator [Rhodococcus daqingensis]|uniref:IclR family transcriptional regulator n=1 Tax=Rhodococcus daqingensis TaxID=2479363 RepID=A0ABW2RSC7_9NOCA
MQTEDIAGMRPPAGMNAADPSYAARLTLILGAFDGPSSHLRAEDVVARTRLPRSTTHRILEQLAQLHWLTRTGRLYRLGCRALALSGHGGRDDLRAAAAPHLHDLHMTTKLIAHLAVLEGTDLVYLDKVGGRCAPAIHTRVGGRVPAHRTPEGKAVLATLPIEKVDALYGGRGDQGVDLGALHEELFTIRRRHGLSLMFGHHEHRESAVSMAVRDGEGEPVYMACLSLRGHVDPDRLNSLAPALTLAVRRIRETLG